ncbi:MAG TPA: sn-glycerol-3-phosphate ABC transporter ATP-binding protein UgpC [Acidimicrobiia bacterium]|nr:sn-glycerol-3-phosphate ABC transporter ATP-binding protein UgpC [Acidimicrobiia bacterium]HTC80581.1 sn-glycerol-3-phosphate ABC transporter ATP-binding protein UgpC [Acidimicrobiia bacterium]
MAAITLEHVEKRYGDGYPAVNDVSLRIADGEFMILVGPSGCGKSTLLRMIVGLEDVTGGEIRIAGQRVNEKAPRDRNLAMVFQNYALYPHLSVFENIAFPLRLRQLPGDEVRRRVEEAAAVLELTDHLDRRPSQLSGGQRQRVAMGRAIVREADAFLFDEPLSNLDAQLRGQMRTEIARLQQRLGVTTVYVTHDQVEAMTLGDRVAVLRKGVLQQVDTPRALYERPVNLFVAGFIGSPAMNLIPATVDGRRVRLPFVEFDLPADVGATGPVLVGIRPEHLEDAAIIEAGARERGVTFEAKVEVVEWLGAEQFAYVPYGAPPELVEPLHRLAAELDRESAQTLLVASIDPTSRIRRGEPAHLWFDPANLYVFDAGTGERLAPPNLEGERRTGTRP